MIEEIDKGGIRRKEMLGVVRRQETEDRIN